ncbi:MAG: HEAT repeat domain-containing protein [Candidatus Acidiferrales bacterium]
MADKTQLKAQSLAVGRTLQMALKTAIMYSVDHPAVEKTLQDSYTSMNALVRQTREFTLGFMNNRVLLNNVLTDEDVLDQLKAEFEKRDIAGVTFEAGISFRDFKRGLALLATTPKAIEEKGGIRPFLEKNTVVGMRITPAARGAAGDTMVTMDPTSYLMAEGLLDSDARTGMRNVDQLLQLARLDEPSTAIRSPDEVPVLANRAAQEALSNVDADMRVPVACLARITERLRPDFLLSTLPPERQAELQGRSAGEVTTELIEDKAARWATGRLVAAHYGPEADLEEEDVVEALGRCLKASLVAERLVQKLSRFIQEAGLPPEVHQRLRQSLAWFSMSQKERHAQLMGLKHFDAHAIRHLLNYVQDLMGEGKTAEVIEVTGHFFASLDSAPLRHQAEGYAATPDLLSRVTSLQTLDFVHELVVCLEEGLQSEKLSAPYLHRQISYSLSSAAQSLTAYEDFEFIRKIGLALEASLNRAPEQHAACCRKSLENLLSPVSVGRMAELYIQRHDDAEWVRTATWLLKHSGTAGVEALFQALEDEPSASNRMRLVRLLEQLGSTGIEAARKRLDDERWYVVRNACSVLGALRDPDLCAQLQGALRHSDGRVQKQAVTTILKSQSEASAQTLAEALPHLQPDVAEMTLDELVLFRNPKCIEGLLAFLQQPGMKGSRLDKGIGVLAAVQSEQALEALTAILSNQSLDYPVRKSALTALNRNSTPRARELLVEFARQGSSDRLVAECQRSLGMSSA